MKAEPECPCCEAKEWKPIGQRTYRRADIERRGGWQRKALQILFETWAIGREDFNVTFLGCRRCGMMVFTPRPEPADIDRKYEARARMPKATGLKPEDQARARQRAERMEAILTPHLPNDLTGVRVLDYGGADGRLLATLVARGVACDLVDYCDVPVSGVRLIGKDASSLSGSGSYDAVVLSHVVEHLAEPAAMLEQLRGELKPGGVLYVEVPLEVSPTLPAETDPITHCNFFVPESMTTLLQRAGYAVTSCEVGAYPHPTGGWRLCVGAIATPGWQARADHAGFAALDRYRRPSMARRLTHVALLRHDLRRALRAEARQVLGRADR